VCGDDKDLINGRPTGAVRVSFGYMSNIQDAQKCLQFIVDCFLECDEKPVYWSEEILKPVKKVVPEKQNVGSLVIKVQEDAVVHYKTENVQSLENSGENNVETDTSLCNNNLQECDEYISQKDILVLNEDNFQHTHFVSNIHLCNNTDTAQSQTANEKTDVGEEYFDAPEGRFLSDIFLYPVKSCAAFKVYSSAVVTL